MSQEAYLQLGGPQWLPVTAGTAELEALGGRRFRTSDWTKEPQIYARFYRDYTPRYRLMCSSGGRGRPKPAVPMATIHSELRLNEIILNQTKGVFMGWRWNIWVAGSGPPRWRTRTRRLRTHQVQTLRYQAGAAS